MDCNYSKGLLYKIAAPLLGLFFFQTAALGVIYSSFGLRVAQSFGIPEEKGVKIAADIFVPIQGTIIDIDLSLDLKHTSFCDLSIAIDSPTGLSSYISFYDEDNFIKGKKCSGWVTLDNESVVDTSNVQNLTLGSFKPNSLQPLSSFYGLPGFGVWTIRICDLIFHDTGTWDAVRLDIIIDPATSIHIPEPSAIFLAAAGLLYFFKTRQ